jgi:hypothetical protein
MAILPLPRVIIALAIGGGSGVYRVSPIWARENDVGGKRGEKAASKVARFGAHFTQISPAISPMSVGPLVLL